MLSRRAVRLFCLLLFLSLLAMAAWSGVPSKPMDFFLRLDPALMLVTAVGARILSTAFLPATIVLLSGLVLGRVFCGYVCPMGATLDGGDYLARGRRLKGPPAGKLRAVKYFLLFFMLGAALFGVSYVFLAAPLSLITRFYGLVVYPVLTFLADQGLVFVRPLAEKWDLSTIVYTQLKPPRFATGLFVLSFFAGLLALAWWAPRFWCRYLCPSGALLALTSRKPLIRRRVSDECTQCGLCVRSCPMDAIPGEEPAATVHEECIVCRTCEKVCPVGAVAFKARARDEHPLEENFVPGRRQFIAAGVTGAATALVGLTGLSSLHGKPGEGQVAPPGLIRPPGARPEMDFLSRCVRCGECMAACPTNTLQPIWLKAGHLGLFSPALTPRRGYCDPRCHACARVCPTEAIRELSKNERIWARTGIAVVLRQTCLAWEHKKACLVCDEVCPFDAVEFKHTPDSPVPVPHVIEDKCAGCGYCEHYCPVQNRSAIVVTAMGALRLAQGSYKEEAQKQGLKLALKPPASYGAPPAEDVPADGPAPGFTD